MSAGSVTMPGRVATFDTVRCDKAQALKPLEEAAEAFAAWQAYERWLSLREMGGDFMGDVDDPCRPLRSLVDECCDVIQATCNLLFSVGVTDLREPMRRCLERNEARGRITLPPEEES